MPLEIAAPAAPVRTLNLLLVDDEPDIRSLYRRVLEEEGFVVTSAADAREAAQAVFRGEFDIALIDDRLPGVRGAALARWLRRRYPRLKVVLFSAYADWDLFFRACGCGACDVLSKDFSPREVARMVRKHA